MEQQQNGQIDFMDLLYDYERRKADGLIKTETVSEGVIKITVLVKDSLEVDKVANQHSQNFSENQIAKLELDKDEQIIQIKRAKLLAVQQFDERISQIQKRSEIFDMIAKEIKDSDKKNKKAEK